MDCQPYMDIYEKSSVRRFIKDVIEITNPLKKIDVPFFSYVEITGKEYLRCLINNDKIARLFIQSNGLKKEILLSPHRVVEPGFYPMFSLPKPEPQIEAYYQATSQQAKVVEVYAFVVDDGDIRRVYQFGCTNSFSFDYKYLEAFIDYFHYKAARLIEESDQIPIPTEYIEYEPPANLCPQPPISNESVLEFLKDIDFRYHKLQAVKHKYCLSPRETQCLELIMQNKVSKEIAHVLDLSLRTIEIHINNLKAKLGSRTKTGLLLKLFDF